MPMIEAADIKDSLDREGIKALIVNWVKFSDVRTKIIEVCIADPTWILNIVELSKGGKTVYIYKTPIDIDSCMYAHIQVKIL